MANPSKQPAKNPPKRNRGARHPNPLIVWADGRLAGQWTVREGEHRLQYAEAFAADPGNCALSLSLPFAPDNAPLRGPAVENWFDNLLPTGEARRHRLQRRFGTASTDAFDLLTVVGKDCAGAVQVLSPGVEPDGFDRIEGVPLTDADIEQAIDAALSTTRASGQGDAVLLSTLAGTQEKIALLRHGEQWMRPTGDTPTTHILKLPSDTVSVENEWLCNRLMAAFGFETAICDIASFGRHKVLVIERFDRAITEHGNERDTRRIACLPQEDFCQALGMAVAQKYEADGGPGMRDMLRVLESSADALADKTAFVKAQMVFWLLAATDVHAKNFSIRLAPGGRYRLTSFYGVNSAWPTIEAGGAAAKTTGAAASSAPLQKPKLAMALRSKSAHWDLSDLRQQHWDGVAKLGGLDDAKALCDELAAQVPGVIAKVESQLPADFPAQLARAVFTGIRETATRLQAA